MEKLRRILVAFLLLLGVYSMKAQTPPDSSANLREIIDWTFAPLDTSQHINTGLLMEKGLLDSSFFWYRGSVNDSIIYNDFWYQLYFSSYNAQVEGNNSFVTLDSVYSLARPYINDGYIPIMGMSFDYNFLNPVALDSNWIDTIDGQVFIEPGQNPFMQDSIFAFAPSTHYHTIFSDTLTLIFPEELFLTNKSHTITSIEVKIDDGEWILVDDGMLVMPYADDPIEVGTFRDVDFTIRVNVYNGFVFNSNFQIGVLRADNYEAIIPLSTLTADNVIVGTTPARGLATIAFGKNSGIKNTCISKPLIIVEGIDFGTETNPTGCVSGKCGSLGFVDILYGKNTKYPELANGPLFVDALVNEGYDIFYLDFEDGATYIENNAMVLVKLIQHINQYKCTNEEIVVVGVSMGGQVAKLYRHKDLHTLFLLLNCVSEPYFRNNLEFYTLFLQLNCIYRNFRSQFLRIKCFNSGF